MFLYLQNQFKGIPCLLGIFRLYFTYWCNHFRGKVYEPRILFLLFGKKKIFLEINYLQNFTEKEFSSANPVIANNFHNIKTSYVDFDLIRSQILTNAKITNIFNLNLCFDLCFLFVCFLGKLK